MKKERILFIQTPSKTDKTYLNMVSKYRFFEKEFKKRYVKLRTKHSDKLNVMLIGFDGSVKFSSKDYDPFTILLMIDNMPMGHIRRN